MSDQSWRDRAVCAQVSPEFWFPEPGTYSGDVAKAFCFECPVRRQCLQDALDTGDNEFGIRGGLSPKARRKLLEVDEPDLDERAELIRQLKASGLSDPQIGVRLGLNSRTVLRIRQKYNIAASVA